MFMPEKTFNKASFSPEYTFIPEHTLMPEKTFIKVSKQKSKRPNFLIPSAYSQCAKWCA